ARFGRTTGAERERLSGAGQENNHAFGRIFAHVRAATPRSPLCCTLSLRPQCPQRSRPTSAGGRDHRNPWPTSIGTGGRLRSESTAGFVGMRLVARLLLVPSRSRARRSRRIAVAHWSPSVSAQQPTILWIKREHFTVWFLLT